MHVCQKVNILTFVSSFISLPLYFYSLAYFLFFYSVTLCESKKKEIRQVLFVIHIHIFRSVHSGIWIIKGNNTMGWYIFLFKNSFWKIYRVIIIHDDTYIFMGCTHTINPLVCLRYTLVCPYTFCVDSFREIARL